MNFHRLRPKKEVEDSELNKSQCIQLQLLLTMTELSTEYQRYQSYLTLLINVNYFNVLNSQNNLHFTDKEILEPKDLITCL